MILFRLLFLPFIIIWNILGMFMRLTGGLITAILGLIFLIIGIFISLTVIGAIIGIPLIILGLWIILRGLF